jgi:hypothetical protein
MATTEPVGYQVGTNTSEIDGSPYSNSNTTWLFEKDSSYSVTGTIAEDAPDGTKSLSALFVRDATLLSAAEIGYLQPDGLNMTDLCDYSVYIDFKVFAAGADIDVLFHISTLLETSFLVIPAIVTSAGSFTLTATKAALAAAGVTAEYLAGNALQLKIVIVPFIAAGSGTLDHTHVISGKVIGFISGCP